MIERTVTTAEGRGRSRWRGDAYRQRMGARTSRSKSAVSHVVARLKALFTTWQKRDVHGDRDALLFPNGM